MRLNPLTYVALCQAAYDAAEGKSGIGLDIDCGGAGRAILEYTIDGLCIAIPGTDNFRTRLCDANAIPAWSHELGCLVHGGFLAAMEAMYPAVEQRVRDAVGPVVITGHSLGGAEALLVGTRLCVAGLAPSAVIAFAPPRPSCGYALGQILERYGVELQLYRNGGDEVPMLPFVLPGIQYQQPATLIQCGVSIDRITDHRLASYDAAMTALVGAVI